MARKGAKTAAEIGLPSIVVVVDEFSDLMIVSKKAVEAGIVRIAQLGRAAGIHLIISTQQPTVNVITSLIKANISCRIALKTATVNNSMVVLDRKGAEKLTGKGDALLKLPGEVNPIRFQAPMIETADISPVVQILVEIIATHRPARLKQPCGVFFCPCGGFLERWGIFGGFFEGDFEKIPHQKPCIFKASGGFWGIGELFLYIYMKCFYNIYKDCEKKAPNPPLLVF